MLNVNSTIPKKIGVENIYFIQVDIIFCIEAGLLWSLLTIPCLRSFLLAEYVHSLFPTIVTIGRMDDLLIIQGTLLLKWSEARKETSGMEEQTDLPQRDSLEEWMESTGSIPVMIIVAMLDALKQPKISY